MSDEKGYYIRCRCRHCGGYCYIAEEKKELGAELWRPSCNVLEALEYDCKTAIKTVEKLNNPIYTPAYIAHGLILPWKMTGATHGASLPRHIRVLLGDTPA